jgi:hypothetical protein
MELTRLIRTDELDDQAIDSGDEGAEEWGASDRAVCVQDSQLTASL